MRDATGDILAVKRPCGVGRWMPKFSYRFSRFATHRNSALRHVYAISKRRYFEESLSYVLCVDEL